MSIKVENLTKVYGEQRAVDAVTFEAKKGEVLGFLGPNGAGKTTTMKMITCFIPQTAGSAEVCGFDTATQSMDVRRRIGYLPENNPLYKDMYIKEYLEFVAGLHNVSNKKSRVDEMIEITGLGLEKKKQINALSKGYRQRVGLAQAMLHDPEVLILDEPTSGLDPNQIIEIRNLIKQLGREKTVIFSTHIMQEVQAICDRVLIINRGKIVADDSIDALQNIVKGMSIVTVEFLEKTNKKLLEKIPGVVQVSTKNSGKWELSSDLKADIRADVFRFAAANNLTIVEMKKEVSSVEDVFQKLTK